MPNYGNINKNSNPDAYTGGYKNVFLFAPVADFETIAAPVVGVTPALGDTLKIVTAHTFPDGKGFFRYACKTHSVTLKAATVGEDGSGELEWSGEFVLLGDGASTQEQLQRLLNDDVIVLLKDADCINNDSYIQLGNACVFPTFKVEFDGKTTKEGMKEYKVTITCKKKYFHTAAIELAA